MNSIIIGRIERPRIKMEKITKFGRPIDSIEKLIEKKK